MIYHRLLDKDRIAGMVIVLAILLVCASMFAVYAIVRTEERNLVGRPMKKKLPVPHGSKNT